MNLLPFALLPGLTAAICAAHDAIQDGVEFLRAHMPAQDRGTVTQERLGPGCTEPIPLGCPGSVGTL